MVLYISLVFVFGILVLAIASAEIKPACVPGEMLKPHTFTFSVAQSAQFVTCRKGDEYIASCTLNDCPARYASMYELSRSNQSCSLTILNVTVQSKGSYSCDAENYNKLTCDFTVFAKPERVLCQDAEFQSQTNEVNVACTAQRVYPYPKCQFTWIFNDTVNRAAPENLITSDNMSTTVQDDFFNATCSLKLPARNFSVGSHQFQVRVYPNVTGEDNDTAYGIDSNRTSPQSVAFPSIRLECPDTRTYIDEGKSFSCTCRETANFFLLSTTTLGYGTTRINSTQNVTGSFIANRNIGELTCEAQLPDGTSNRTIQTVRVAFGPIIFNFEANNNSQQIIVEKNFSLSFSCQVEGNPSPMLSLRKNGAELERSIDHTQSKLNQTLTYSKPLTDCLDTGVYTCLAEGGQTTTYKTMAVYVKCKPDFRNPDNLSKIHHVRVNGTVSIYVPIFGYPEPNVILSSTNYNLSSNDYNLTYLQQEPPYGNVSLTMSIINFSYFQNYTLIINNTEGPVSYSFEIVDGDPVKSDSGNNDPPGTDVGAIVGGIVAAVLVIVIIFVIIFFLKRKGAPCNKKQQNGKTTMHTPYGSDSSEELPQVQTTEPPQYEEIIDVQYDMPDRSEYFTQQIPNIRDEEVQYVNTV